MEGFMYEHNPFDRTPGDLRYYFTKGLKACYLKISHFFLKKNETDVAELPEAAKIVKEQAEKLKGKDRLARVWEVELNEEMPGVPVPSHHIFEDRTGRRKRLRGF
jgi:hypothetical protein